jgi:lantibiotic modifying enzyme
LDVATTIGDALVRDAVWHEDRCSWIGSSPVAEPGATPAQSALGPDLYAGTSGVGVFLGALAAVTGRGGAYERTAVGALRHALSRLERRRMSSALYTGRLGILLAAALIGRLLDSAELRSRAASGVERLALDDYDEPSDLVAGRAGAVIALLALGASLDHDGPGDAAIRVGDDLIRGADGHRGGLSWPSASEPSRRALTGLAHGAAGVAYALVELFAVSGEQRHRHAALEALRYERQWFDRGRGNWLDFREGAATDPGAGGKAAFACHWCHGAAGIAVSRARAYEVLGDPECRNEAEIGAATTRRSLESAVAERRGNYSLCHGLCGNADVLLSVAELLASDDGSARSVAHGVAAAGADGYVRTGVEWPCGSVGPTPGLMLGLAGIGYFYLRLHEPRLPSPLLVSLWPRLAALSR